MQLLLSISEAARQLGVARKTVSTAMKQGRIRFIVLNKRKFIPRTEIERLLAPLGGGAQLGKEGIFGA